MAKPITATPPVFGEEAEALEKALRSGASSAEMAARVKAAERDIQRLTQSKGFHGRHDRLRLTRVGVEAESEVLVDEPPRKRANEQQHEGGGDRYCDTIVCRRLDRRGHSGYLRGFGVVYMVVRAAVTANTIEAAFRRCNRLTIEYCTAVAALFDRHRHQLYMHSHSERMMSVTAAGNKR